MGGQQVRAQSFGMLRHPAQVRRARPGAAVAQWLMLFVALAALMAMHGLSDHGVGGPVPMSAGMTSAMASAVTSMGQDTISAHTDMQLGHAGHPAPALNAASAAQGDADSTGGGHGGHGGHDGMLAGMCLAVMAAVLALGIAAWRTRLLAYLRDFFGDLNRVALTTWRSRSWGPAPPDLNRLSIQRC